MMIEEPDKDGDDAAPSKSQRKRQMSNLQALGEKLVSLPTAKLQQMHLPESLMDALLHAQQIRAHGALRRQLQFVGRLMREVDPEPIRDYLDALEGHSRAHAAWQHRLEEWRERMLKDDDALAEFVAAHPGSDTQRLHTLIRNARREKQNNLAPRAFRELLRVLREYKPAPQSAANSTGQPDSTDES
jgi:ribosome-associated protein